MLLMLLAAVLMRGPLIQNPANDPTKAQIVWYTDVAAVGTLEWDTPCGGGTATGPSTTRHSLEASGLDPGGLVTYRVKADGVTLREASFLALPGEGQSLRAVVIGDFGRDLDTNDALATSIAALNPRPHLLLTVGDNVYTNGTLVDANWLGRPEWVNALAGVTVMPAWGNHDHQVSVDLQTDIFELPENGGAELWYRVDAGPASFLVLDTMFAYASVLPQRDWISAQVSSLRAWRFALYHHSQLRCGDDAQGAGGVKTYWEAIFESNGIHALAGHAHTYSRAWADRRPKDGNGMWHWTVGRSGQEDNLDPPTKIPVTDPPVLCTDAGFAAASWMNSYLVIDADGSTLTARLIAVTDGSVQDSLVLTQ